MNARFAWTLVIAAALTAGCGQKQQASTTESAPAPDTAGSMASSNPSETQNLAQNTPEQPPAETRRPGRQGGSRGGGSKGGGSKGGGSGAPEAPRPSGPQTVEVIVPSGRSGAATLETKLSSETSKEGDTFTATLAEDWVSNGEVAFPAGTKVMGHLSAVAPRARGKAKARLTLAYDKVSLPDGRTIDISAQPQEFVAGGDTQGDAAKIIGGTAGGAIIGGATGNVKRGAIIGGLAGVGAALLSKGHPMDLDVGHPLNVVLTADARVTVKKATS